MIFLPSLFPDQQCPNSLSLSLVSSTTGDFARTGGTTIPNPLRTWLQTQGLILLRFDLIIDPSKVETRFLTLILDLDFYIQSHNADASPTCSFVCKFIPPCCATNDIIRPDISVV
jgi:hypothetical protein